uniref:Folylpolyglutamate synthase n=1 Tax=Strix occidentalis caurina TaxID=311401 RepID=A0A8D0G2G0_STROC
MPPSRTLAGSGGRQCLPEPQACGLRDWGWGGWRWLRYRAGRPKPPPRPAAGPSLSRSPGPRQPLLPIAPFSPLPTAGARPSPRQPRGSTGGTPACSGSRTDSHGASRVGAGASRARVAAWRRGDDGGPQAEGRCGAPPGDGTCPRAHRSWKRRRCPRRRLQGRGPAAGRGVPTLGTRGLVPCQPPDAIRTLNTLQTNASYLEQVKRERGDPQAQLEAMRGFLERSGLKVEDLDRLNIIHVTGTKGKGSACAFTECILRSYGLKTGFYSSPHLVQVRERIRINGQPISKELFSKYFWLVYNRLEETKVGDPVHASMPAYFRFLTIMAFHVFLQEKVDLAVVEVGIGGAYDCTNIIRAPVVCGVSSLGIDHVSILGDTMEKIAWQKGGIFKPGVPAFTVAQPERPLEVLRDRAQEREVSWVVVVGWMGGIPWRGAHPPLPTVSPLPLPGAGRLRGGAPGAGAGAAASRPASAGSARPPSTRTTVPRCVCCSSMPRGTGTWRRCSSCCW